MRSALKDRLLSGVSRLLASFAVLTLAPASSAQPEKPEHPSYRTSLFFVGGRYAGEGAARTMTGQMYVQAFEPERVTRPHPVVMVHGTGQTGNNFLATAEGRPGWAHDFASRGYRVYVVDQVGRGRSGTSSTAYGKYAAPALSFVQLILGVPEAGLWPQVRLHTQWPGRMEPGDATFDQFMASQVEFVESAERTEEINLPANIALLERIGPAIVLTHSQSGVFGWKLGNDRPDLVKALVAVEPNGPPFHDVTFLGGSEWFRYSGAVARASGITRLPLSFEPATLGPMQPVLQAQSDGPDLMPCWLQPEPARQLPNLAGIPTVIVTGEASFRATYDHCTSRFLAQAGVPNTHLRLESVGLHGNGHMMMMEKNSAEIAGAIADWIEAKLR
jgi:pimeloyl-ACP methyl ester carboxylesterase